MNDILDTTRDELHRAFPDAAAQRIVAREALERAMDAHTATPPPKRRARRLAPISAAAVAAVATLALLAIALHPGGSGNSGQDRRGDARGLRLVQDVAGDAFAGLDLTTASAADVLTAAGDRAAAGAAYLDMPTWTYTRAVSELKNTQMTQGGPKVTLRTVHETWTRQSDGRRFGIDELSSDVYGTHVTLNYEDLRERTLGTVSWLDNDGTRGMRRANWHTSAGDGETSIKMVVALREQLDTATTADDVERALDDVLDIGDLEYRDGMACDPTGGCMSFSTPTGRGRDRSISTTESRLFYGRGLLLNTAAYEVHPPAATRAIYEYLAALDGTSVDEVDERAGTVELRFAAPGANAGTGERVVIDRETGRIVERAAGGGGRSMRWTDVGGSDEPVTGGTNCPAHPAECEELRELAKRLESDPKAQFKGVVDWMRIDQYCDGLTNRDGSARQSGADDLPRIASKDPKVRAEAKACRRREAAAAAAASPG